MTPATLLGLLADDDRRRVVAALVLGARTQAELRDAAALDNKALAKAVGRLRAAGLVADGDAGSLMLNDELFTALARDAAATEAAAKPRDEIDASPEAVAVLRNFVRGGRLERIPAQRAKRLVVLDWLASRFDPGKVYPERDINFELGKVHADSAALRRYLVDEGFFERREGFYWRAGGTFEVDGPSLEDV